MSAWFRRAGMIRARFGRPRSGVPGAAPGSSPVEEAESVWGSVPSGRCAQWSRFGRSPRWQWRCRRRRRSFQHAHPAGKGAWPARRCPSRGLDGGRPVHRSDHRCAAGDDDITGGQLPDLGVRQPCHLGQHAEGADAAANPVVRRQLSATSVRTWSRTISLLLPVAVGDRRIFGCSEPDIARSRSSVWSS